MSKKRIAGASLIIGISLFASGFQAFAFTEPASAPPQGDAFAPLNTSGNNQTKSGYLYITNGSNNASLYGDAVSGLSGDFNNISAGGATPLSTTGVSVNTDNTTLTR